MAEEYINHLEFSQINSDISDAFSSDSIYISNQILQDKYNEICNIEKNLQLSVNIYQANKAAKKKDTGLNLKLEESLKQAYQMIMQMRNYFLGAKEEIQYKIYYREPNSDLNDVKVFTINEDDLLKFVYRDKTTLRIPGVLNKATIELLNNKVDQKATEIFNKHFQTISNSLRHPGRSKSNYIVGADIVSSYGKKGQHYTWQPGENKGKGKSAYTFKLFNRGWIYQAFDATIAYFQDDLESINAEDFRNRYFTEELKYDNLKGFKGGDVGLNQIKTNSANLMSSTTLLNYLKQLRELLEAAQSSPDRETLKAKIKDLFLDPDRKIENDLNLHLDKMVEDLLNSNLKTK